jgi:O-antigen/teichoic acid export membrane protein
VNLVINILLVPSLGMVGAAIGTLVSLICMLTMSTHYVRKIVPFVLPWKGIITGFCCALVFIIVEVLCKQYLPMQNWTKLLIGAVAGGVLYIGLLLATKTLSKEDLTLLRR